MIMAKTKMICVCSMLVATMLLSSCNDDDDPKKGNEEELITTVTVDLVPEGDYPTVQLKFYDEDGAGSIAPVITPEVAQLKAGVAYAGTITLQNESVTPAEDITTEIEEEEEEHLFCFTITGVDVTVGYADEDDNNLPVGLSTRWEVGNVGDAGTVTVMLRHQPEVKDGNCPGNGDTDIQVVFPLQVVQ